MGANDMAGNDMMKGVVRYGETMPFIRLEIALYRVV